MAAAGKSKEIAWSPQCQAAFQGAKDALAKAAQLHHPSLFTGTALSVDASDSAVGAELAQRSRDGSWRPIAFFSRTLSSTEKKYSAFDRELLAIYLGIKHFRHFLEGRSFAVYTDHKPLTFALESGTDRSPRQSRHLSFIAEFTADIRHVKGTSNIVADMLSRPEPALAVSAAKVQAIDYAAMAEAQDAAAAQDTSLKITKVAWNGILLLCDSSTGTIRPLVPEAFRKQIFQAVHCLSHPGARPTTRMLSAKFVWKGCLLYTSPSPRD